MSRRIIGTAEAIRRVSEVANMFSQWYKLCVDNSWLADVWRFSVRDNGIGIAKGHQPRIFQIFERIGEKDTERL